MYRRSTGKLLTVSEDLMYVKIKISLSIKNRVLEHSEFNLVKTPNIVDKNGVIIAELSKTIYVADKLFYKEKRKFTVLNPTFFFIRTDFYYL